MHGLIEKLLALLLIPSITFSATIHMSPGGVSDSQRFVLQVALQTGESLGSFDVSISVNDAANVGFLPLESAGSGVDYSGTAGNLLADGSTIRILGDTTTAGTGAVALPEGVAVVDLFEINLNRLPGFINDVDFILLDWELAAKDFSTLLTATNSAQGRTIHDPFDFGKVSE